MALREARTARGLTQLGLAKLCDIAPQDISRIENGWLRPYPSWRRRLSKALAVPEAELFPTEGGDNGQ